jgi:predicted RecA/RadA family phage recombinase
MEARFIHDGKAIDFLSSTAIPAGTVIIRDALVGITKLDVEANRLGALHVVGVYDVAKADVAIPLGSKVYWDATAKKAVIAAGTNPQLGIAVLEAAADDTVVRVRIG